MESCAAGQTHCSWGAKELLLIAACIAGSFWAGRWTAGRSEGDGEKGVKKVRQVEESAEQRRTDQAPPASPHENGAGEDKLQVSSSHLPEAADKSAFHVPVPLATLLWMCGEDVSLLHNSLCRGWLDIVGRSLEELYNTVWEAAVHPDDLDRCKKTLHDALAARSAFQMEYRLCNPADGSYRWILEHSKPRWTHQGPKEYVGYVGWRVDIHERKEIEEDYERYWSLPHEILAKVESGEGKYFGTVSPSFVRLLGYASKEEALSIAWQDYLHPEDRAATLDGFQNMTQRQIPLIKLENRYRCKPGAQLEGPIFEDATGRYKWLEWTAKLVKDNVVGAARDISEEKEVKMQLVKSRNELQSYMDAIPAAVYKYVLSEDGKDSLVYMSKGGLVVHGLTPEEAYEDPGVVWKLTHPDDAPALKEALKRSWDAWEPLELEFRSQRKDTGESRWVRTHANPQRQQGSGSAQEWCGITWDITDSKLAEEALREARDAAEKANKTKSEFLANMSHEIRTPMNAVIGMGALLLETALTEEQREYVSTIRASGEALLAVINDILDFSKIEAGRMSLEEAPFDVAHCVEESLDLVTSQAVSKGLDLSYAMEENVPEGLQGDVSRVRQILVNLLSNATKFTDTGSIRVHVSATKAQEADLNYEIEFQVIDSGIGIPEERRHLLFQAFSQIDPSTTRRYGGTGLGLAICARLCKLQGGRIWVESTVGGGSTFHFTIRAPAACSPLHSPSQVSHLAKRRVLVVDNEGALTSGLKMLTEQLRAWHMRPLAATSAEALELVCRGEPLDLVVLDHSALQKRDPALLAALRLLQHGPLPPLDARKNGTQRKEAPPTSSPKSSKRVPLVLVTAFGRRAAEEAGPGAGVEFAAVLSKPVKGSQLLHVLNRIFQDGPRGAQEPKSLGRQLPAPIIDRDMARKVPLRILVAEDNVINQKVVLRLLSRLGYSADVVANGLEALEAAGRQRYDVCLMDCFMPEMDGLEATRRIREHVQPCPVIVAVTAAALDEERQACLEAGMDMYIAKPIQVEELMGALKKSYDLKGKPTSKDS